MGVPIKSNWERHEDNVRRKVKGKKTPGSGNKGLKGDISSSKFLIECKWRDPTKGVDIKYSWLDTIRIQATKKNKQPLLVVSIGNIKSLYFVDYLFYKSIIGVGGFKELDFNNKTQFRINIEDDLSYHILGVAGGWVILPESGFNWLCSRLGEE